MENILFQIELLNCGLRRNYEIFEEYSIFSLISELLAGNIYKSSEFINISELLYIEILVSE